MKRVLVGNYCVEGGDHFIPPYALIESDSVRDAVRTYNESLNYSTGEVMCIVDKRSGRPTHINANTDYSECISAIENCNINN